jgi:small subunit ribosomal protein S1
MPDETTQQPTSIEELQPKMQLQGKVTRTELYGAFVDVGVNLDGLIHISRLATGRVRKVTDVVSVGDTVSVWVQSIDPERGRIALTMVEPPDLDWEEIQVGQVYSGEVVRVERYGLFVDIGAERPGLLHVREMGSYVRRPEEFARLGDTVRVDVRAVDPSKRQIDFTAHNEDASYDDVADDEQEEEEGLSPMEIAFLQAQAQAQAESDSRRFRGERGSRKGRGRDDMEDIYRRTLGDS